MNKLAIINSPIYPMITSLVKLFGLKTRGLGGKTFGSRILFRSTRINCFGIGNKIEIGDYCRCPNRNGRKQQYNTYWRWSHGI